MYGKLFASTFTGSMMGSGPEVFSVWAYAIANADAKGFVEMNPKLLAAVIGSTDAAMGEAIKKLSAPDPSSRSREENGARIVREGMFVYRIVNYAAYRGMRDADERRTYQRKWVRGKRSESHDAVDRVDHVSTQEEVEEEVEERSDSSEPANAAPEPVLLAFPVCSRGSRPKQWGLTKAIVEDLRAAFPGVDVMAEAQHALVWLKANPTRQKTHRGMFRFLLGWCERTQNRSGGTRDAAAREAWERIKPQNRYAKDFDAPLSEGPVRGR